MMNSNYMPEIASASKFIIDHNYDGDLRWFLRNMMEEGNNLTHSERWSTVYDWMQEHYPAATGSLITGISYWLEK